MNTKQKEKEKDLVRLLQDNKSLAELLSKVVDESAENEKKMKYYATKKVVGVVCEFVLNCCNFVHLYLSLPVT